MSRRQTLWLIEDMLVIDPDCSSRLMEYYRQVPEGLTHAVVTDPRTGQAFEFRMSSSIDGCLTWGNTPPNSAYWSNMHEQHEVYRRDIRAPQAADIFEGRTTGGF